MGCVCVCGGGGGVLALGKEKNVPLVEFMYLVFTRKPVRVTVGYSGLCCTRVAYFER